MGGGEAVGVRAAAKLSAKRAAERGLKKQKWYCQLCGKQCRDANGFKNHQGSEAHRKREREAGEEHSVGAYSARLEREFVGYLRQRHGTRRVLANVVWNELISDRREEHVHLSATRWPTLGAFVAHLGKAGVVRVEEGPSGATIQWEDTSAEGIKRRRAEERARKEFELVAAGLIPAAEAPAASASKGKGGGHDAGKGTDPRLRAMMVPGVLREAAPLGAGGVPLGMDAEAAYLADGEAEVAAGAGGEAAAAAAAAAEEARRAQAAAEEAARAAKRARPPPPPGSNLSRLLSELKGEAPSTPRRATCGWLRPGLVVKLRAPCGPLREGTKVRVMEGPPGHAMGGYPSSGVTVEPVSAPRSAGHSPPTAVASVPGVQPVHCRTVLPALGGRVLFVRGPFDGHEGVLESIDEVRYHVAVRDAATGTLFDRVEYDDVCKVVASRDGP